MAIDLSGHFSDPDGDPLTYSATGLPPGIAINAATGELTGTPTTPGNYTVTVTATDPGALTASDSFEWNVGASDFELIIFSYIDDVPSAAIETELELARDYWNSVLTTPLPATLWDTNPNFTQVQIDLEFDTIDGPGGHAAVASGITQGTRGALSLSGTIRFDPDDMASAVSSGWLKELAIHEIGHVLGIGTTSGQAVSGPLAAGGLYTGAKALAEYETLTGESETSIPLHAVDNYHWSESVFGAEIMTPTINTAADKVSRMTLAVLEDLGYNPDYTKADPYSLP